MQQMTQNLHLDWHNFKVLLILRKPDWYYSDLWIRSGCCVDVYLRLFGNQMTSSFLVVIVSVVPSLLLSYVETTLTFVCPSCRSTMCQPSHPFSSLIAYQVHGGSSDGAGSSCHCVGHRLSQGQPRLTDRPSQNHIHPSKPNMHVCGQTQPVHRHAQDKGGRYNPCR